MLTAVKEPKAEKFNFETMQAVASHKDPAIRKQAFIEYYERFKEFPSYLFDNKLRIDANLFETMQDLIKDEQTTKEMRKGIDAVLNRLPS